MEGELHGIPRGEKKLLADVVYGAEADVPRLELDEKLRLSSIAPTEDEEEPIARGGTVRLPVGATRPSP